MTAFVDLNNNMITGKNVFSVTGATSIGVNAKGKLITFTGSTSYAVTLPATPASTPNCVYEFICLTTNNALVTINTTISGQSSIVIGRGDSGTIYCDGTNYELINVFLQPVNVYAQSAGAHTYNAGQTQFIYGSIVYNVGGFFASNVFTPLMPGKYTIWGDTGVGTNTGASAGMTYTLFDGSSSFNNDGQTVITGASATFRTYTQVYFNGTTNFVYGQINIPIGSGFNTAQGDFYANRISLF